MELINQHVKGIMEGCKERARDAGLRFQDESLEYIVTNRDLLELMPKVMIPTLYDYWVHDVEVLKEKGKYELYPSNPYETVINTRPPISFYNDNNPDWLNVMIFYHVLGHIDFFQNNLFYRHTWDIDFTAQALSDKRLIARLRGEKGRWVDYVIEFSRGVDNLVGYHSELAQLYRPAESGRSRRLDYYFDIFLQSEKKVSISEYIKEISRYNACLQQYGDMCEQMFFSEAAVKYPEMEAMFDKSKAARPVQTKDLLKFMMDNSEHLNKEENKWMKSVMEVVRKTSIFFQPQIRTKIMNEGWASYWHETLFLHDDRIRGHEVEFARINAGVTAMPRVGLNPYALGMRLYYHIEEMADKGKLSFDFQKLFGADERDKFDSHVGGGRDFLFKVRENMNDFMFIKTFVEQDFVNRHKLFVVGKRLNQTKMVWEYFVKSRKSEEYRNMLFNSLYHPPHIEVDAHKTDGKSLYLNHLFEGKPLVREFITNTMMGIEYLWGGPVHLETSEPIITPPQGRRSDSGTAPGKKELEWQRVVYTMQNRQLTQKPLE